MTQQNASLIVERVRHTIVTRLVPVVRTQLISPQLVRVTLAGPELQGFESLSFDDHVKVFFPEPGQDQPVMPAIGPNGLVFPEGVPRAAMRDYTPRRYNADTQELDLEFVLHGDGPAGTWAAQARPGQYLGLAGPRGSFVVPLGYDWHVLMGDETALPAIARRLEELPAGKRAIVRLEVANAESEIPLQSQAELDVRWLHRDAWKGEPAGLLAAAAQELVLPAGEGYVWIAAESLAARAAREVMVIEHHIAKDRIRAASYWKRGVQAVHETHDD